MHIQHEGIGNALRLFVLVGKQRIIQIFKERHILRHRVFKVGIVNMADTLVNDTFLIILQTVLSSGDQVT